MICDNLKINQFLGVYSDFKLIYTYNFLLNVTNTSRIPIK